MFKKLVYLALFVFINLGFLLPAYEGQTQGVISLPETGQKKCYNSSGTEISCAGTGQDGEIRAGVEWPQPRFIDGDLEKGVSWPDPRHTDLGDGIIYDNLTFSLGNQVNAEEISLLSNPGPRDNSLWLIDPSSNPYGQVGYYPPDSRWHIAQWGILNRLPEKTKRYGKGWNTQNKDASVSYLPSSSGGYVVDLKQDSRNPNYGSIEFDLLLEPNHFIYPTLPQNLMHYDNQPSLGSLAAVRMKAWQKIVYAWHGERGSLMTGISGSDLASTLLAVAMINPYTSPQQILFYQVITYDSRGLVFNKDWFDNGTWSDPYMTYGVDDSVQNYGMQALTIGHERTYNLNIIDRLKQVVLEGPASLDKDLHHWKVAGGLFFGSWVNGEAVIHSKISSIDFTYEM